MKNGYLKWERKQDKSACITIEESIKQRIAALQQEAISLHNFRWHHLAAALEKEAATLALQLEKA